VSLLAASFQLDHSPSQTSRILIPDTRVDAGRRYSSANNENFPSRAIVEQTGSTPLRRSRPFHNLVWYRLG